MLKIDLNMARKICLQILCVDHNYEVTLIRIFNYSHIKKSHNLIDVYCGLINKIRLLHEYTN